MVTPNPAQALAAIVDHIDRLEEDAAGHTAHLRDTERRLHEATVMVGELRQRLHRAETRLAEQAPEEAAKARRDALMLGDGYIRVTSRGGGRYEHTHMPARRVIIRAD